MAMSEKTNKWISSLTNGLLIQEIGWLTYYAGQDKRYRKFGTEYERSQARFHATCITDRYFEIMITAPDDLKDLIGSYLN